MILLVADDRETACQSCGLDFHVEGSRKFEGWIMVDFEKMGLAIFVQKNVEAQHLETLVFLDLCTITNIQNMLEKRHHTTHKTDSETKTNNRTNACKRRYATTFTDNYCSPPQNLKSMCTAHRQDMTCALNRSSRSFSASFHSLSPPATSLGLCACSIDPAELPAVLFEHRLAAFRESNS